MKNKVLLGSLFLAFLSSNIFAQDIDDEIQRLEKENKLLELKKKQKQLQNELQDDNPSSDITQTKKESNQKDLSRAKEKSGFFVGVEGVLESVQISQENASFSEVGAFYLDFNGIENNIAFDGGLLLGYQKYFGESAKHGLKISTHLYSGLGYKLTVNEQTTNNSTIAKYTPIKVGIDIKYLWDFLEKGKSTLGLNVGLGYEFDYYISKFTIRTNSDSGASSIGNVTASGIYPTIGLHYAYNVHHLFEINYRFGGIMALNGSNVSNPVYNGLALFDQPITHRILAQSYLALNYAYKF